MLRDTAPSAGRSEMLRRKDWTGVPATAMPLASKRRLFTVPMY